ncbi:MAG: dTDP-4-dehydrorhamnose reductase [Acidobacteria bacterium]|nr:dTDP-4-dehydrorhamnose reductase [Acidobacteriota bacterium]
MRALVVGGTGMLGQAVTAHWLERGAAVLAVGSDRVDLTRPDTGERAIADFAPELVVNCAAFTRVDDCESEPELAMAINGTGVGDLARATSAAGAKLIHISTDYVFDGESAEPYDEAAAVNPRSVYGESKLEGERQTLRFPRNLVLRTSWLFGPGGGSFAATIVRLLADGGQPLRVVADQHGCPTYAPYLAATIWELAAADATGVLHYCNREATTWHGFALAIVRAVGREVEIEAISTEEMPRPAERPAHSVLSVERIERLLGHPVEPWQRGLESYLEQVR